MNKTTKVRTTIIFDKELFDTVQKRAEESERNVSAQIRHDLRTHYDLSKSVAPAKK